MLSNLSVMSLELRATILADQKRVPEAKALFDQAAREEKKLGYREPPAYVRPVGETEGAVLLRAGDACKRARRLCGGPEGPSELRL